MGEEGRDGRRCRFLAYGRGKIEVYDLRGGMEEMRSCMEEYMRKWERNEGMEEDVDF